MTWSSQDLPKIVTTGVSAATSSRRFGSSSARFARWRVEPKAASFAVRPGHRAGRREELDVLRVGAGPAALDVGHAVLVEHPRDADLVGERERDVLALRAVAQGRVVQDDRLPQRRSSSRSCRELDRADPLRDRVRERLGPDRRPTRRPMRRRRAGRSSGCRRRASRARTSRSPRPPPAGRATSAASSPPTGSSRSGSRCRCRRGAATSRGWARRARPCRGSVRRSPSDADGSIPRDPASTDASSERMSPNMFSVTMTSNAAGFVMSDIAVESTSRCSSVTSGNSTATSSTTARQSRLVARTFALSTLVSSLRRPRASSNASRVTRRISGSV